VFNRPGEDTAWSIKSEGMTELGGMEREVNEEFSDLGVEEEEVEGEKAHSPE